VILWNVDNYVDIVENSPLNVENKTKNISLSRSFATENNKKKYPTK